MGNNALVSQVLETSGGRAPDMTHALGNLGNGDMGAGIKLSGTPDSKTAWLEEQPLLL